MKLAIRWMIGACLLALTACPAPPVVPPPDADMTTSPAPAHQNTEPVLAPVTSPGPVHQNSSGTPVPGR